MENSIFKKNLPLSALTLQWNFTDTFHRFKNRSYRNTQLIGLFDFNPFIAVHYPANIYLFKDNNRNTRKRCETCSTLTIKTPQDIIDMCSKLAKQSQCIVFIVNFGHLLRTYLLLQNFPKFTRKHLRCSTFLVKLPGHPENLAKCFLKPILKNILK